MKILGIDTSPPIGRIALIDGDTLVAEHTLNEAKKHTPSGGASITGEQIWSIKHSVVQA